MEFHILFILYPGWWGSSDSGWSSGLPETKSKPAGHKKYSQPTWN
jgi:hypothetical protein